MDWIIDHAITILIGALAGIGCYWYFIVHRKLINIPDDIDKVVK